MRTQTCQAGAYVAVGHLVRELIGGDAECDNDRQVIEQLQRCGGATKLPGIATGEAAPMVRPVARMGWLSVAQELPPLGGRVR